MFDPVSPQVSFPALDEETLSFWEDRQIFERSVQEREGRPPFVYYEGPPTANGTPHPGHILTRIIKDVFLRYRTMAGFHVPRRGGWDTHGLPVEVEVEKELGIHGRAAIEQHGIEAFNRRCIESVFRYIDEWRRMDRRIGFWIDLDRAYVTFHQSYVESAWWALKTLYERDLLYQDYKIVWWWPQGGTALSAGEVGQGYRTVDDPSVVVRFPVQGESGTSFLAWTTTPWTLPSNIALAVHPEQAYATVELEPTDSQPGERVVVAEALREKLLKDRAHRVVASRKGREIEGARYEPPFRYAEPEGGDAYRVVTADFVTVDTGSGMVHMAPAFGEDDFRVCKEKGLGFLQLIKPDGTFVPAAQEFAGRFCKDADRDLIRHLRQRDLLFSEEVYRHEYPFCWRAMDDPLIQYARKSWFIRTTREIDRTIANNEAIHWEPAHIKEGRMGDFLRSNVDWALSRERFWGTPLPIWINDETGSMDVVGSVEEILSRNPQAFDSFEMYRKSDPECSEHLRVHRPWVDLATWTKEGEPGTYRRVPEVIDCWFDSGAMPFAQQGYPHQGQAEFGQSFPADFITEAIDQTRGWFYTQLTLSTLLFPEREHPHPFKNCVVLGLISDEKGQKLSKSKKNYTDPLEMIAQHGADAVRWALYTGTVPGQATRFSASAAPDALRDFLLKVWNVYSFFVTYANIDRWSPQADRVPVSERPDLDRWILAELDDTVRGVREALDSYRSHVAARKLAAFNESLSNWYVRRSRSRFWAEGESSDKRSAFATLYEALSDYAALLAPFTPFLADAVYRNLHGPSGGSEAKAESVHLADFPSPDDARVDEQLRTAMDAARVAVTLGQRVRAEQKIKVRQPLSRAIVVVASPEARAGVERFGEAIREELNVHAVEVADDPAQYVTMQLVPNFRVLGPKLGRQMPACKKALAKLDGAVLRKELEENGSFELDLPDGSVTLTEAEIEVRLAAREDFAAAASGAYVVVLDTKVTPELRREGLAREVINRIQRARKTLDLAFDARIQVTWEASDELAQALEEHGSHVAAETLATQFLRQSESKPPPNRAGERHETDVDGASLAFYVVVAPEG